MGTKNVGSRQRAYGVAMAIAGTKTDVWIVGDHGLVLRKRR
jgi:hypothetical protein